MRLPITSLSPEQATGSPAVSEEGDGRASLLELGSRIGVGRCGEAGANFGGRGRSGDPWAGSTMGGGAASSSWAWQVVAGSCVSNLPARRSMVTMVCGHGSTQRLA